MPSRQLPCTTLPSVAWKMLGMSWTRRRHQQQQQQQRQQQQHQRRRLHPLQHRSSSRLWPISSGSSSSRVGPSREHPSSNSSSHRPLCILLLVLLGHTQQQLGV